MVRIAAPAALLACLTSGCSYLPAAGPTASAIVDGADVATPGGVYARYELVDVSPAVIEALRSRPLDSLLATFGDRSPSAEPVIGVGDSVAVQVWEAGSGGLFSGPLVADRFSAGSKSALIPEQVVSRDGAISVPYAGRIQVAGRRPQDVQVLIESELAGKAIQPQVLVTVSKPISQSVTVTGEVTSGARIPLSGKGDRLLDVVAGAGGVRGQVSETYVRLSRGQTTVTVPLTAVVSNPRENIFMRPSDVLTLVRDPQTFMALGALGNATEIPFSAEGITLSQGLARARGLSDLQADAEGVFLFRFEPNTLVRRLKPGSPLLTTKLVPVVYRFNMRDPQSLFMSQAFRMRSRDMLYVSNAPFTEVQKVLSVFSTVTAPVSAAASVYGVAR
ncbi:polysaccharide biosynthesis/export family protein [Methylobacterium brachythecii]|uniref:Polysaccharide export outer membrane protein n=1 Tax=Methylobacterium brachythecii TaxID=1176177 RepID=A0A7W6ALS2_9HYPH|nr:polysaccharide biosynthesis/export family protein [Methylobacterium brachythecii]MBB3904963.1 polysaccharide export outer membrane protein [Methylobacterium brachythecii]